MTTKVKRTPNKPVAVIISDVHFNQKNLILASTALAMAVAEAEARQVPLIIAGDLNDTKAILRAECANAIIEILCATKTPVLILVGNHDLINEKGKAHSLEFLRPFATVIDEPLYQAFGLYFIPYQTDTTELEGYLSKIPDGSTVIMHQGSRGAHMGEYVVDKSSITAEQVKHLRVITGHYHRRQDLGTVSYVGTPYTVTFHEAHDPAKGFRVLNSDGTLDFVPTDLRKHVVVERSYKDAMKSVEGLQSTDLLWLKLSGPASELDKINKKELGLKLLGHQNFKLDKLYDEVQSKVENADKLTEDQLFDAMIEQSEETPQQRKFLKTLWREIMPVKS